MFPHRIIPAGAKFYSREIPYSCRFNDDDSAHTTWTPGVAADSSRIMTIHLGFKRCNLGLLMYLFSAGGAGDQDWLGFDANDKLIIGFDNNVDGQLITTNEYRDPTSHYWITMGIDTTDATAANRVDIEVNGVEVTAYDTETYPAQNYDFAGFLQNGVAQYISRLSSGATNYLDGYLSDLYIIDGTKYTASDFGSLKNNIWIPGTFVGSYGTNGGHYDFADSSDFGKDVSGNGNDFTDSGLATNDQVLDTPTDNYCVFNNLDENFAQVMYEGNLRIATGTATYDGAKGTFPLFDGAYYEFYAESAAGWGVGIIEEGTSTASSATTNKAIYFSSGGIYVDGVLVDTESAFTTSDIIGVAYKNDKVYFAKNNVWQNSADPAAETNGYDVSGLNGTLFPYTQDSSSGTAIFINVNFGQLGFAYTPPAGFKALRSSNMDDPTIMDSSDGCVTDSDTGANIPTTLAALRSGWINYIDIYKNLSNIESWDVIFSDDSANSLHFDANDAKGAKQSLAAGDTYSGVSLRAETTYGIFTDEVSHTNGSDTDTAHSLGSADVGIVKLTDIAGSWHMDHPGLSASRNIVIDTNAAESATVYCTVDATNITIASGAPTGTYRVIAFRETQGFSKFDIHTGNANADGPYSDYGGRAAVIMFKNTDDTDSWLWFTDERLGYNIDNNDLNPDTDAVEGTADMIDIVSQGGKVRINNAEINANAEVYISLVWMAQTGKYSNAR